MVLSEAFNGPGAQSIKALPLNRNYHVFYYLLVGASEEERKEFKLLQPEDYLYLKQVSYYH